MFSKAKKKKTFSSSSKHSTTQKMKIGVVVRCRPLFKNEMDRNSSSPKSPYVTLKRKEIIINQPKLGLTKKFDFDTVFVPSTSQIDIFSQTVQPIVEEVLKGYNCTIFAYGQTTTGKTHTMEGGERIGKIMKQPGIIPQSVEYMFKKLHGNMSHYAMKISCIELYNEVLTDLLIPIDSKIVERLRIYDDKEKGMFVQGLKDTTVNKVDDVLDILESISHKRHIAETELNKNSSRSHVIYTLTVHVTEKKSDGEEFVKTGKLNLVDLAGSENIRKSGTITNRKRSREAGTINQSLLTLGRVITALHDNNRHIPYRESKLTRLLQDSLGGKQKTCLIATITNASKYVEETIRTLEYAHKAKTIKNTPVVNIKIPQGKLLNELQNKLNAIRSELDIQREKNGVYLSGNVYTDLKDKETKLNNVLGKFESVKKERDGFLNERNELQNKHDEGIKKIESLEKNIITYQQENNKLSFFNNVYNQRGNNLFNNANTIKGSYLQKEKENQNFAGVINNKIYIENTNFKQVERFNQNFQDLFTGSSQSGNNQKNEGIKGSLISFASKQRKFFKDMEERLKTLNTMKNEGINSVKGLNASVTSIFNENIQNLNNIFESFSVKDLNDAQSYQVVFTESCGKILNTMKNTISKLIQDYNQQYENQMKKVEQFKTFVCDDIILQQKLSFQNFIEKGVKFIEGLEKSIENRKVENSKMIKDAMSEATNSILNQLSLSSNQSTNSLKEKSKDFKDYQENVIEKGAVRMNKDTNEKMLDFQKLFSDSKQLVDGFSDNVKTSGDKIEKKIKENSLESQRLYGSQMKYQKEYFSNVKDIQENFKNDFKEKFEESDKGIDQFNNNVLETIFNDTKDFNKQRLGNINNYSENSGTQFEELSNNVSNFVGNYKKDEKFKKEYGGKRLKPKKIKLPKLEKTPSVEELEGIWERKNKESNSKRKRKLSDTQFNEKDSRKSKKRKKIQN